MELKLRSPSGCTQLLCSSYRLTKEFNCLLFSFAFIPLTPYLGPMNTRLKNPHTFDMSNYYSGMTYMVGGRDFEREENDSLNNDPSPKIDKKIPIELDWSFLKSTLTKRTLK